MNKYKHVLISSVLFILLAISLSSLFSFDGSQSVEAAELPEEIKQPHFEFGLCTDSFIVVKSQIEPNQFLADILLKHHIPYPVIDKLVKETKDVFDTRKLAAGKKYAVFCTNDSLQKARYFIYQQTAKDYVVFDISDSICSAYTGEKEVEIVEQTVSGTITSSLYESLMDANASAKLAVELANIYAWTIDFYRIQKGDGFKIIFNEKFIEGESIGAGKIKAAIFNHNGDDYYAFYFNQNGTEDYFDEKGNSLRKAFLKAPLKFSRISSGYTLNRYHPVQKRNKPHYGTDYAAPKGTPIMAVGNGVVVESQFKAHNGNYVKIKHNGTYTTQYLHMSKRAVKTGQSVKQGDIIGYVGSTGLATGPHVCFRFWKNGKQVNHLKEKFPPSLPIDKSNISDFKKVKSELLKKLDSITEIES